MDWRQNVLLQCVIFGLLLDLNRGNISISRSLQSSTRCDETRDIEIIASKTIRRDEDYQVRVTPFLTTLMEVVVKIIACPKTNPTNLGCTSSGDTLVAVEKVVVHPEISAMLTFKIGMFDHNKDYFLHMEAGRQGKQPHIAEEGLVRLTVIDDYSLLLTQFDRPIYKPSDTVNYHILMVDDHLMPISGPVDVFVKDPKGTIVEQNLSQEPMFLNHPGFYQGNVTLSRHAPLGDWTVEVRSRTATAARRFSVAQYVLPRFSVGLQVPAYVHSGQATLRIIATAQYKRPLGKSLPVDSQFHLRISGLTGADEQYSQEDSAGSLELDIPVADLAGTFCSLPTSGPNPSLIGAQKVFNVSLKVTDIDTKKSETVWRTIPFYCDPFVIYIDRPVLFHPGLPYTMLIDIRGHDRMDYTGENPDVLIVATKYGETLEPPAAFLSALHSIVRLDTGQRVNVSLSPTISTRRMDVVLKIGNVSRELTIFGSTPSAQSRYMHLTLLEQNSPTSYELRNVSVVSFQLSCTEFCNVVDFLILSRGMITQSGRRSLNRDSVEHLLDFEVLRSNGPLATLVVYYYHCAELIAASSNFRLEGPVQNEIILDVQPESNGSFVRPGQSPKEKVVVTVTTEPESLVGTLALDKRWSSAFLAKDNSYRWSNEFLVQKILDLNQQKANTTILSSKLLDISDVIKSSGLITMTITRKVLKPAAIYDKFMSEYDSSSGGGDVDIEIQGPGHEEEENEVPQQVLSHRDDFRENFFFTVFPIDSSGSGSMSAVVPDAITTWDFYAFSLHNNSGLSFAKKTELDVYQELSVEFELPYNMIRNENATVDFLISHHLREMEDVSLEVTMKYIPSGLPVRNSYAALSRESLLQDTIWKVPVSLAPSKIGTVQISAQAIIRTGNGTILHRDTVIKSLDVRPEGVKKEFTSETFNVIADGPPLQISVNRSRLSSHMIPDSLTLQFVIYGGSWAPVVKTLTDTNEFNGLIQLPGGCGEQNMALLVPNIYVMKYLAQRNLLTPNKLRHQKLKRHIKFGYENQFYYQLKDHSFSAWGKRQSKPGSTWLSAFVLRGFSEGREYIENPRNMDKTFEFLESRQSPDGSFIEKGFILEREKAGPSIQGAALTAFVTLAFAENGKVGRVTEKARSHLLTLLPRLDHYPHTLAIVTYALAKLNSTDATAAANKLRNIAVTKGNQTFWSGAQNERSVSAKTVEATAYAVLAFEELSLHQESDRAVNWLQSVKRDIRGGFVSTQDTVVALAALNKVETRSAMKPTENRRTLDATVVYHPSMKKHRVRLTKADVFTYKPVDIPSDTTSMTVHATGSGRGFARLIYHFYEKVIVKAEEKFQLNTALRSDPIEPRRVILEIECSYHGPANSISEQVFLDVEALTGYRFENDYDDLSSDDVEVNYTDDFSRVVISLAKLDGESRKFDLRQSPINSQIRNQQPRAIKIYEYYEPENSVSRTYSLS